MGVHSRMQGAEEVKLLSGEADRQFQVLSSPSSHLHLRAQIRKREITGVHGLISGIFQFSDGS